MINLSSASLNTPETDVSKSITQLSEQRQQTIAQFDYNLPVTDREYESIGRVIQQNPDEEPYRFASAIRFSRELGLTVENAMMRLDDLTEYQTGKKFSPTKSTWKAIVDSFEMGKLQIPKADLEKQYKYLDLAGEDTTQIEQQIAEYERMFTELGDSTPRNLLTQALKAGAQTLPYTAKIALGGASKGMVAGLGAAGAAALFGVAAVGALPVSIAASIIAVATAAGTAFSFKEAYDLMEGGEYYRMRKNGIPKDIALPMSNMSAWVQAGVESFLGLVPAGIGNITGAQTLTSRALAKLAISGKWGTAGKFLGTWVGQSFEEGAEEAVQALTGWTADIIAAELSDVMPPERSIPILTEALEGAKQGFLASLVLGAGGSVMSSVSDTSLLGQIRRDAQATPSKESFIDKHRANAPEGVAESEWTTALSEVYEQNKPKRTEAQAEQELDATPGEATSVARLKSGRIYAQESEQVSVAPDGSESRILKVGDPISSKRYGYIGYTRTDNAIEIDEVRFGSTYENVRKESILELGRQNPGVDIVWNPQTEALQAIRDEIIAEQGSLNPYTTNQTNVEPRLALQEKIKQAMPTLDAPQRTAAATLIELRAEAKGMTLESYMDTYFDQRVFAEEGLDATKRGGITFEQTEDGVKALIYAGKNADFSTFSHEAFHLFRREMAQTPQLQSALTQASQDKAFSTFIQENKSFLKMDTAKAMEVLSNFSDTWTRDQEELVAGLWELYLKEGKAPTSRLEALFDKIKNWFGRIYGRLSQTTQLDPRIREVFDSLLDKDSELAQQVRGQEQPVVEGKAAQEQLFQEALSIDNDLVFEDPSNKDLDTQEKISAHNAIVEAKKIILDAKLMDENVLGDFAYAEKDLLDDEEVDNLVSEYLERAGESRTLEQIYEEHVNDTTPDIFNPNLDIFEWAIQAKGTTDDINEAGYVLPDGTMLDFSGKRNGGEEGERSEDHRELNIPIKGDISGTKLMVAFQKMGAMRVDANTGLIDLEVMPTSRQLQFIRDMIEMNEDTYIDLQDGERRTSIMSMASPQKVIGQIRKFYSGGEISTQTLFQPAPPTDSPAFKKWFGDSKVVDENGKPLVVYHGTANDFLEFDRERIGENYLESNDGFFFIDDENTARIYAKLHATQYGRADGRVIPVYLSIQDPYVLQSPALVDSIEYFDDHSSEILSEARGNGNDGIVIKGKQRNLFVALSPTQIKSVNNQGTFDPTNPNILYQDENTILTEASQFSSWEDFRDGYTAFLEAMYDEVPDYDDDWFRNTWDRANPTGNDQASDQRFLQDMNGEGLIPFLKEIGRIIQERLEQPGDQEEADYTDRLQNIKARIQQEVSPFMRNTALQSLKTTPSKQSLKAVRTTIENATRFYRDVYAEVMNKPDMKPMVIDEFLPSIDEPLFSEVETASITERVNLSKRIEATELKKKILSGKETFDGEAEKVIRQMDSEIKAEQEKVAKLEADLLKTGTRLSDTERKAVDLSAQIEETRRELDKAQKNIQKRIAKNQSVPQSMMNERANLSEKVKNLMSEFNLLSKTNRTKASLDKQQAVKKAKDSIRAKQKEKADAVRVRKYKERLAAKIMAPVSKATDYKYKLPILAIQATIDPKFRTGNVKYNGKTVALKDIQAIVDQLGEYDITQTLPKRIADRLDKTPLNELTLVDLEEIASRVATLRKTGRLVQQARSIFQSELANSYAQTISNSLIDTGKYTPPPATGSVEDIQSKRSVRERFRSVFYDTLDMPRKAIMLDNDTKGTAYDLLVDRQRDAYRTKESNIARRMSTIEQVMKETGITYEDAYKQVEVDGTTFTISDLAMVYMGAKNEQSRMAIAYGNLMDARERDSMTNEEVRSVGDERLAKVLDAAEANLSADMLKVLDAISNDFNNEFDRMNEVAIREFNTPISRVDNYVPIRRQEMTGDDLANAVADDWMNMNAGGAKVGIQKGMTITRVNISPKNQKPMKLDLFGTHAEAINMQEHFIAFAEYGRELNRVFKGNQALRETIRGTYGDSMLSDIDDYINEVINPKAFQRMKNVDKAIRALRGNLYAAYLTYKTSGVVLQFITSPMPFLAEVNPLKLASAYLEVTTKPRETMQMINELSVVMRNRVMDPAWKLVKDESAKYSRPLQKKFKRFQEIGGMGMEIADKWSVAGGWLAVFKNEIGKAELVDDAVIQKAVRKADEVVLRTQPSSRPEDLAPLFKQGGEALKAFTQFQTALNVIWKNVVFDVPLFIRQGEYAKAIGQSVGYVLAGALLGAVMNGYDDNDDEAQKTKKLIYWGFTQFTDSVPLIGTLVNNVAESIITGEKPYMFPSTFYPSASEIAKGVINLSQGEWEKAVKDLSEGFGYATGLPVSGAKQIIRAFDEGPQAVLGRIE